MIESQRSLYTGYWTLETGHCFKGRPRCFLICSFSYLCRFCKFSNETEHTVSFETQAIDGLLPDKVAKYEQLFKENKRV